MNIVQELVPFNKACEELVTGKYILVDMKINTILNTIDDDDKLRDIVNSACENNNFDNLLALSRVEINGQNKFVLPNDENAIICLVYNLLYNFANKDLILNEFLSEYYNFKEDNNESFNEFSNSVIMPFRDAIIDIYTKRHVLVETSEYQSNYYNRIKTNIKLILNNIDNYKLDMTGKDEFVMLLNALYLASDKCDKKLVYTLMIGIDYFTKAHKKSRIAYLTLEECFN